MPSSLSAFRCRPVRLLVVLLAGMLAAGLLSPAAQAATSAAQPGRIGGLVFDQLRRPLAGAVVELSEPSGAPVASTAADSKGRWALEFAQGRYDLAVTSGTAGLSARVRDVNVGADSKLNVVVAGGPAAPVRLTGRILDGDGQTLAGLDVGAGEGTITGPDGRFSLEAAPGRYPLAVSASRPDGDLSVQVHSLDLNVDRDVTLTLPLRAVDVVVRDEAGAPINGAAIRLWSTTSCASCSGFGASSTLRPQIQSSTMNRSSDSDGRARIITVPSEQTWVSVTAPDKAPYNEMHSTLGTKPVAVTLAPGGPMNPNPPVLSGSGSVTFAGRVLDANGDVYTGDDAEIGLDGFGWQGPANSTDGAFSFTVPAGRHTLLLQRGMDDEWQCCQDRPETYKVRLAVDLDLTSDRYQDLKLPASRFPVTVVGPDGAPVPGAWVRGESPGVAVVSDLLFAGAQTRVWTLGDRPTGADGTVSMDFVAGALPSTITVDPPGGHGLPTVVRLNPAATSAEVHLKDGPTLRGRLLDGSGEPLHATHGWLVPDSGPQIGFTLDYASGAYAVTAPAGRYRIRLDNTYRQEGESTDSNNWYVTTDKIDLTGDRTLDLTVPLGVGVVRTVGPDGLPLHDFEDSAAATALDTTSVGSGIDATGSADMGGPGSIDVFAFQLIGPAVATSPTWLYGSPALRVGVHVAPGEDTVIAFAPGTGPDAENPPPAPPATTTTTTPPRAGTPSDPPATGATASTPVKAGYWALSSDGRVYNFGEAAPMGNTAAGSVDLEPSATGNGYWTLNQNGTVRGFGDAAKLGDVDTTKLAKGELPASLSATPSGKGYWVFTNRGRAISFGDAAHLGDMSATKLNGPVLGSVATPSGKGYYMVASDGGIFAFGDATFVGSMGGQRVNAPVQSLVPDSDGKGYWLVASDGGIFAFDAPFRGSMGGKALNRPVVGMVRYGDGYLMVGADGGIFNFSSAPFAGSLGDKPPASPVVAVAALP